MRLTKDQTTALDMIVENYGSCREILISGHAGVGKTTLMHEVYKWALKFDIDIAFLAPTHRAVEVLKTQLSKRSKNPKCRTIHAFLGLELKRNEDRFEFVRAKWARRPKEKIVVIDECSMISQEILDLIRLYLSDQYLIFVGDKAQLPPIGESISPTFSITPCYEMTQVLRQGEGHPIKAAAQALREMQGSDLSWHWAEPARTRHGKIELVDPKDLDKALKHWFCSKNFEKDQRYVRFLCWTNRRVDEINKKVQNWIYGDLKTPFGEGERVVFKGSGEGFSTNQEGNILKMEESFFETTLPQRGSQPEFRVRFQAWRFVVKLDDGDRVVLHSPHSAHDYRENLNAMIELAKKEKKRWEDVHAFQETFVPLQSIFASTVHTAQGGTFDNVIVDVSDIRKRSRDNVLETQQLFYVAVTRPRHTLVLVRPS